MRDGVKIRKTNFISWHRSSRSLEYAECGCFTLLFCKERQRNQRIKIITHAYRALRVPQGFLGNEGTREIWQWEHGNKAEKS